MERRIITSMVVAMLFASLVASPAASASPGSGTAVVDVHVAVHAKVDCTAVDNDHIDLRSNAPWRLTFEGADGATTIEGAATGSIPRRIALPAGTLRYYVTLTQ